MRRLVIVVLLAAVTAAGTFAVATAGRRPADDGPAEAVGGLRPALAHAFAKARQAAEADGVELTITSGWRSAAHQQELYEQAIEKYGSPAAARRWVLPPNESAHVRGEAIDVSPPAGATWLRTNGVRFGLCQVYANEPWHFERLAPAIGSSCPPLRPHA